MHVKHPSEIPFWLGETRAFVNPPLPPEFSVSASQLVYRADQSIRINRGALHDHYDLVLRQVVRLSRLSRSAAHEALQDVLRKVPRA